MREGSSWCWTQRQEWLLEMALGQTPFDVADEGLVEHLEMLQKQQSVLRSEKETRNKLIESDLNSRLQGGLFNKEKMLYEEETPKSHETEEESKESSSSSSEEEGEDEASESETEKEAATDRKPEAVVNHSSSESKGHVLEQTLAPAQTPAPSARRIASLFNKLEEPKDESPSSWRLGLRKTGSHNTLSAVADTREAVRDRGSALSRSASSPRISALLDNRDKERESRSYLSSLAPRRLSSTSDAEEKENRESAVNLVRSGSYTRQLRRDEAKGSETPQTTAPSTYVSTYLKRAPHRSLADSTAEKADSVSSSTPLCVITNRPPPSTANGVASAPLLSTPGPDSSVEARERRRSYLTPVRDEEAESLRKARSRQARQTRRSTQGVTLTDLQEAERTFSRSRAERQAQDQPGQKLGTEGLEGRAERHETSTLPARDTGEGRQPWGRGQEEEPACRRLRGAAQPDKPTTAVSPTASRPTLYTSSHLLRTSGPAAPDAESSEAKDMDRDESEEAGVDDPCAGGLSVRERRRPRERRRGTGISFWTKDEEEADGSEEVKEARLYEGALTENQKLKTKLQEAQLELADVKSRLEKVAQQKQEKTPDRSSLLEVEKRERRALERKMSEMEEEMKVLTELKSDNQRLKDENGALIRVISKLSK
ncbi:Protein phosphatase 1 regulatory subunit 12B [Myotis brandtii]|uniref:Protein phosphatase 1 regulatory subunit 12B n=1 Tax=Myotis brandtii TaxID=109478 RepID=S7QGB7_MYOBR|nr:Protein phosphatase 1 regulatory subunit 12B [Myotis brandtii]